MEEKENVINGIAHKAAILLFITIKNLNNYYGCHYEIIF